MIDIQKGRYWDLPWSLVDGCSPISPGCDHCWSAAMTDRFRPGYTILNKRPATFDGFVSTNPGRLYKPLKRKKPTVYAVWNDLFHESVPHYFADQALGAMQQAKSHTFLVLTKRAERAAAHFRAYTGEVKLGNVYLGLTVCNQQEANEKIPVFLQVPGKKFLSIEPMLGPIDLRIAAFNGADSFSAMAGIDAVILGGETGPGARPLHPDWVRSVRDQCQAAGVPFFFKGWGNWRPCDDDHVECGGHAQTAMRLNGKIVTDTWRDRCFGGSDQGFWRAGAKAGRLLDGRTYDDLPWRT